MFLNQIIGEASLGDYPDKALGSMKQAMRTAMSRIPPEERNKAWAVHDKRKRGLERAQPRIMKSNRARQEQDLRDRYAGVDIDAEIAQLQPAVDAARNDAWFGASNTYSKAEEKYSELSHKLKELQTAKRLLSQGVAEGFFGTDDKIKGKIQNLVSRLSDEYGMWDHKAQTFTPQGLETLKSMLKFNEKYIKYALSLTHKDYEAEGVAEVSDRDPGALASRAHIASQERKHQDWAAKQKELEDEFYANHPELDDRHKTVDNLVKEFSEMLSRTK